MNKKITSFLVLLLCMAYYDMAIKNVTEFDVNLNIFYHVSIHGFILFWVYISYSESKSKLNKRLFTIISTPFILRIAINLFSIDQDYDTYSEVVNNKGVDYFTWASLVTLCILLICEGFIRRQR